MDSTKLEQSVLTLAYLLHEDKENISQLADDLSRTKAENVQLLQSNRGLVRQEIELRQSYAKVVSELTYANETIAHLSHRLRSVFVAAQRRKPNIGQDENAKDFINDVLEDLSDLAPLVKMQNSGREEDVASDSTVAHDSE